MDLFPWPPPDCEPATEANRQAYRPPSRPPIALRTECDSVTLPSLPSMFTGLYDDPGSAVTASSIVGLPTSSGGTSPDPASRTIDPALGGIGPPFCAREALLIGQELQPPECYIAAIVDGIPIPEAAKCTIGFVGSRVVQGGCFQYEGLPSMLFAFSVSVSTTGGQIRLIGPYESL